MSIFKKLAVSFMTVCLAFLSFAGCSLVEIDTDKYYKQTVASYNNSEVTIDMKELVNGYYNFGNENYDNSGNITIEGLESTINTLLNRKILVNTIKNGNAELNIPKITLTLKQTNDVWQQTYDYINNQIKEVENELRKAADDEIVEDEDDESTDSSNEDYEVAYSPFTKTYTLEYDEQTGKNVLKKVSTMEEPATGSKDVFQIPESDLNNYTVSEKATLALKNFKKHFWNYTDSIEVGSNQGTKSYSDEAFTKYISNLHKNETDKTLSDVPAEIFYRELDRLFEIYLDNQYLSVYQSYFSMNSDLITEEMVLQTYRNLVEQQIETYTLNPSKYVDDMKNNADTVLYHPNTTDWFKVTHILIKFSDEQSNALTKWKEKLDKGDITLAIYNQKVAEIKSQTTVTERYFENGELHYGNTYSAEQVLNKLNSELIGKSYAQKLKIFNDYIYRFNMDTGVMNANSCYYIPADSANDQMVASFANESRTLRTKGAGSVSSNLVESTYGYHIIMYLGEISQIDYTTASLADINRVYINPLDQYASNGVTQGKTLLDAIIEKISISNYSAHEAKIIDQIKLGKETVYYKNIYQELVSNK